MVTLDSDSADVFMQGLYPGLKQTGLPAYAMPRLVRITKEYVMVSTSCHELSDPVSQN